MGFSGFGLFWCLLMFVILRVGFVEFGICELGGFACLCCFGFVKLVMFGLMYGEIFGFWQFAIWLV